MLNIEQTPNGYYDPNTRVCLTLKDPRAQGLTVNNQEIRRRLSLIEVPPKCLVYMTDLLPINQPAWIGPNRHGVTLALNRSEIKGDSTAHYIREADRLLKLEIRRHAAEILAEYYLEKKLFKTALAGYRLAQATFEQEFNGLPRIFVRGPHGCARG